MKKIRWGIVGLGNIAKKFAADLSLVPDCVLQAVASSDALRAEQFAQKHKAQKAYSNYDQLFSDPEVDLVYIASLHPKHADLTIRALAGGKGVLCEKPLGMNSAEVDQMISQASQANLFLMEGLWTRFNPSFNQVKKWIDEGQIGALRYIHASFSFNGLAKGKDSRLFHPDKGGGSLLDIGIYPLFLAYYFLGIPGEIDAKAHLTEEGVDAQLSSILSYPKAQAMLYSSFIHDQYMGATLCGEKGEIYMYSRWHEATQVKLVKQGEEQIKSFEFSGLGYTYEIEEANRCFNANETQSEKWTWQNSIDLSRLMDAIRAQVGVNYTADTLLPNRKKFNKS
ncbi:MAG: Gfo/Idh/MocA family oxidoreductase [Flavobacteriaceae bacterium]|jgi:predicted dehydrogenase